MPSHPFGFRRSTFRRLGGPAIDDKMRQRMAEWFRCTNWNEQNEAQFFRRLKCARHQRPQYVVIQALTLVHTGRRDLAEPALSLIELFFQDHYEQFVAGRAFSVKARALVMLERWEDAFQAFEEALQTRRVMPYIVDDSWLEYPLTIARRRARERYRRALTVLKEFLTPGALIFPLQQMQYFATLALICADEGDREGAKRWAQNALAAAAKPGPFSRHPDVGIVGFNYADLQMDLEQLAGD